MTKADAEVMTLEPDDWRDLPEVREAKRGLAALYLEAPETVCRDVADRIASAFQAIAAWNRRTSTGGSGEVVVAPYHDNGIGSRLIAAAETNLADYVFSPDEGADHFLTDFERELIMDWFMGLTGDDPFNDVVREAQSAINALSPSSPAVRDEVVEYARVIEIVNDSVKRMKRSGESHQMLARWISEGIRRALSNTKEAGE